MTSTKMMNAHRPILRQIARVALCAFALLASQQHAALAADPVEQILATGSLSCTEAAVSLLNRQLMLGVPDGTLNGFRRALKFDDKWAPGNENYDRVRAIAAAAVADDIQKNGPMFTYSSHQAIRDIVVKWSPEDQRYFAAFFARPAGRLYWSDILEGAICKGWLKTLSGPPFPPLQGEDKARWDALNISLDGGMDRFMAKLQRLPKEERASFDAGYKRLSHAFDKALVDLSAADSDNVGARVKEVLRPHVPEMAKIYQSYHPQ